MSNLRHPHESVDSNELPIVVEESNHPARKHVEVQSGKCEMCGYDRLRVSHQTGHAAVECMLCGARTDGTRRNWSYPDTDRDRRDKHREWAESDGGLLDHCDTPRTADLDLFTKKYRQDADTFDSVLLYDTTHRVTEHPISRETLTTMLKALEQKSGFVTEFVAEHLDGKAVTANMNAANNPNATRLSVLARRFDSRKTILRMAVDMDHSGHDTLTPIHMDPRQDGIAPE